MTDAALRIACCWGVCVVLLVAEAGWAGESVATVADSEQTVVFLRRDSVLYLDSHQAAAAFGWEAKLVTPGRLLTLCRGGSDGVCVPVLLSKTPHTTVDSRLYVDARALARALRIQVNDRDGHVVLGAAKDSSPDSSVDPPAYNAAWGPGRGFEVGQTLPDIPLYDMQGDEVRFSRFLGRQYILYCWSSW